MTPVQPSGPFYKRTTCPNHTSKYVSHETYNTDVVSLGTLSKLQFSSRDPHLQLNFIYNLLHETQN
jgi:hypothetical protein